MNSAALTLDIVHDLYRQCIVLLVVNALLSGLAILLAWRSAQWKAEVDALEEEMRRRGGGVRFSEEPTSSSPLPTVLPPPVPRPADMRRIPATKFPKK
jgi:hypothetical protein